MKAKREVSQNVRKFMSFPLYTINWGFGLLISVLLVAFSCSKNDEIEPIEYESPIINESHIIYTDVEPDFISENINDFFELDLNKDQIVDFTLSSIYYPSYYWDDLFVPSYYDLNITSNSNDASGIISVTPWYYNPVPLDSGKEIFDLSGYTNGETYENWGIFNIGGCEGGGDCFYDWKDKNDKYLGLRFPKKNGGIYYGWVRLDITNATHWVIKEYAYNATPNKPILAGQKE